MRKHILFPIFLLFSAFTFAQVGPGTTIKLTQLEKSKTVESSKAGQIGLTNTAGQQRYAQFVEINPVAIGYTPTATGNTDNLSEFVIAPDAGIWYIDWQGNALEIAVSGGGGDHDWYATPSYTAPGAITQHAWRSADATIGGRYQPSGSPELTLVDSSAFDASGGGRAGLFLEGTTKNTIGMKQASNGKWNAIDGSSGNMYFYTDSTSKGLFIFMEGYGQPNIPISHTPHFSINTSTREIQAYFFPNTRNDSGNPVNVLNTDANGKFRSDPVAEVVAAGGGVVGSITNTQIGFGDGSNHLTSSANLTYANGILSTQSGTGQKVLVYESGNTKYGFGIGTSHMQNFHAYGGGWLSFGEMGTDGTTYSETGKFDKPYGWYVNEQHMGYWFNANRDYGIYRSGANDIVFRNLTIGDDTRIFAGGGMKLHKSYSNAGELNARLTGDIPGIGFYGTGAGSTWHGIINHYENATSLSITSGANQTAPTVEQFRWDATKHTSFQPLEITNTGFADLTSLLTIKDDNRTYLQFAPRPDYDLTDIYLGSDGATDNIRIFGRGYNTDLTLTLATKQLALGRDGASNTYNNGDFWSLRKGDATSGVNQFASGTFIMQNSLWDGADAQPRYFSIFHEPLSSGVGQIRMSRQNIAGNVLDWLTVNTETGAIHLAKDGGNGTFGSTGAVQSFTLESGNTGGFYLSSFGTPRAGFVAQTGGAAMYMNTGAGFYKIITGASERMQWAENGDISIAAFTNNGNVVTHNGSGVLQSVTPASIISSGGGITGSIGDTQVAFGSGTQIAGNNDFKWDNSGKKLSVTGTARITGSDGTPTNICGRDGDGDVSNVTIGSGLSLSGGTLSSTSAVIPAGTTTNNTLRWNGTAWVETSGIVSDDTNMSTAGNVTAGGTVQGTTNLALKANSSATQTVTLYDNYLKLPAPTSNPSSPVEAGIWYNNTNDEVNLQTFSQRRTIPTQIMIAGSFVHFPIGTALTTGNSTNGFCVPPGWNGRAIRDISFTVTDGTGTATVRLRRLRSGAYSNTTDVSFSAPGVQSIVGTALTLQTGDIILAEVTATTGSLTGLIIGFNLQE